MDYPDYGIFFIDASIRLVSHNMTKLIEVAKRSGGVAGIGRDREESPYSRAFPTTLEYMVGDQYRQSNLSNILPFLNFRIILVSQH